MKQEKKLLEVGDVVYLVNSKTNDIRKLEIIKTTKLLAGYDIYVYGDRLRKEVINGKVDIYGGFKESHINYYLPTPELTQQYQEKQTRLKIQELIEEEIELKTLTLPQLLSIQSILQNQTPEKEEVVGWIKVEDLDCKQVYYSPPHYPPKIY